MHIGNSNELGMGCLWKVYGQLKGSKVIVVGLFSIKSELVVVRLSLPSAIHHISRGDHLTLFPGVRKDCVGC